MNNIVKVSGAVIFFLMIFCQMSFAANVSDINISGEINAVAKIQDSYMTPLDKYTDRAGANYRDDQYFRGYGELVFSYGDPGKSPWFAAVQIEFDANDPDVKDDDYFSDPSNTTNYRLNNNNISDSDVVELGFAFAMYRPFEIRGGRPFGIMAGVIPFKATANAAYFNFFKADQDEDFIIYTCTAITEVPGIGFDFHISEDTGCGFGFVKGVEDASELGLLMNADSADNFVVWAEAKYWNIGFNFATQFISGEGDASKKWTTPAGNELYEYDEQYDHILFNSALTYSFKIREYNVMPAITFQYIKGDECQSVSHYNPRDVELGTISGGIKFDTKFFNIPGEFALLYTEILDPKKFEGLKSYPKGAVEYLLNEEGITNVPDIPIEGTGKGVLAMMEIRSDIHIDYTLKMSKHTEVGLFYYSMDSVDDKTKYKDYIKAQLEQYLAGSFAVLAADPLAQGIADDLKILEWTDTTSFGIFCRISF